jgi:hypothetical protein
MLSIMSRPPGHRDADIQGRGHGISRRDSGISLRGSGIAESAADRRNAAMNKADFGRA